MPAIGDIKVTEIIDSKGGDAIDVTVILSDGARGTASVSTLHERHLPSAVGGQEPINNKPVKNDEPPPEITIIEEIKPSLVGGENYNQQQLDKKLADLDGTPEMSRLRPTTMIVISMAFAKASAYSLNMPLYRYLQFISHHDELTTKMPIPAFTMIDGGKNANFMIDMEEFLVVPASFKSFHESLQIGITMHDALKTLLSKENLMPIVGEKGGFGPFLSTNEDGFSLIKQAIESINLRLGYDVYLGLDVNANSFFRDNHYKIKDRSLPLTSSELQSIYEDFCEKYHVLYLEDPMAKSDFEGWANLYRATNQDTILAGDYLTSSNPYLLQEALGKKALNAIVIKPVQAGTVTEALAVAEVAKTAGIKTIVSDRTSETNETFLADFAVAAETDYVKFGGPVRGERVAKYNRLLEIEKELTTA